MMAPTSSLRLVVITSAVAILLVVQLVEVQVSVAYRFRPLAATSETKTSLRTERHEHPRRSDGAATTTKEAKEEEEGPDRSPRKHITAAVCHPTLHGRPDLRRVIHWAAYYKALGFDHVFLWHNPGIQDQPHFEALQALPFVTLGVANETVESYYGQFRVESECFTLRARNYTWALAIDADEYLWLAGYHDVKDFLAANDAYKYLSFGKWMYTARYRDERPEIWFGGMNRLAFTSRSYCFSQQGSPACPTWVGRAKIMARPEFHPHVRIHGDPSQHADSVHFHTRDAHLKEWPGLLAYGRNRTTARSNASFVVEPGDEDEIRDLNVHWLFESHQLNTNGTLTMHYDSELNGWFEALAARLPTSDGAAFSPRRVRWWLVMLAVFVVGIHC